MRKENRYINDIGQMVHSRFTMINLVIDKGAIQLAPSNVIITCISLGVILIASTFSCLPLNSFVDYPYLCVS